MINMATAVVMTTTMFLPNGSELKQAWQSVKTVTMEHCILMNDVFAQGGTKAVITVRCAVDMSGKSPAQY